LAAILLPVFASARENARRSSCQNNLKQIGTAVAAYSQDYDELMPCTTLPAGVGWETGVYSYLKSQNVFHCPDDVNIGKQSYAGNQFISTGGTVFSAGGTNLAIITSPTTTFEVVEYANGTALPTATTGADLVSNGTTWSAVVHGGSKGSDYVFCDGHVKYFQSIQPDAAIGVDKTKNWAVNQ
jgi:prepilin-type processing-associated H-X9-DG protein